MRLTIKARPRAMPRPRGKAGQRAYYPKPYQTWRERVGWMLKAEFMKQRGRKITQPCSVFIQFHPSGFTVDILEATDRRGTLTGDVDNYAKAILDMLQEVGIIENDSQVNNLAVKFVDELPEEVEPLEQPTEDDA